MQSEMLDVGTGLASTLKDSLSAIRKLCVVEPDDFSLFFSHFI